MRRCFPDTGAGRACSRNRTGPRVQTELARAGVTLKLLHQGYAGASFRAGQAVMNYSRFCRLHSEHAAVTGASSRVGHKAARSIEVD